MKPLCVIINGERWDKYFADYQYEGANYSFEFFARNDDEAVQVLRAIRTTATECFKIEMQLPAIPGVGIFARAYCFIRNLFVPNQD